MLASTATSRGQGGGGGGKTHSKSYVILWGGLFSLLFYFLNAFTFLAFRFL